MASATGVSKGADQHEEEEEDGLSQERVTSSIQTLAERVLCDREEYVKQRVLQNKERLGGYIGNFVKVDEERKRIWKHKESSSFSSLCLKIHETYGSLKGSEESSGEKDGRLATLEFNGTDKPISIIFGFQTGGKTTVRSVKLPKAENVPPYTTWIYLDRNQRMTEDQSVVGRRRIYYDSFDNETRIASDSEEEDTGDDDDNEPTHDFSKGEDSLIWLSVRELGKKAVVLTELSDFLDISTEEIEARSDILKELYKNEQTEVILVDNFGGASGSGISSQGRRVIPTAGVAQVSLNGTSKDSRAVVLSNANANGKRLGSPDTQEDEKNEPKDLLTAMDSFDNLFCRRCLVFDCRLHGCSQAIVHPSERQQPWGGTEEAMSTPCGTDCYLLTDPDYITRTRLALVAPPQAEVDGKHVDPSRYPEQEPITTKTPDDVVGASERLAKRSRTSSRERSCSSERQVLAISTILEAAAGQLQARMGMAAYPPKVASKEKKIEKRPSATRRSLSRRVKQNYPRRDSATLLKPQLSLADSIISLDSDSQDFSKDASPSLKEEETSHQVVSRGKEVVQGRMSSKRSRKALNDEMECNDPGEDDTSPEGETTEEKFALVAVPEVLGYKDTQDGAAGDGVKTDIGVGWSEMEMGLYEKGLQMFGRNSCLIARNLLHDCKTCAEVAKYTLELDAAGLGGVRRIADSLDIEAATRARLYGVRRKKGARKLKYTFRSVVHPLLRKRMSNGKDLTCRQYTPCNCLYTCGKQCPCLLNGTCCEKYCGCSKSCKNRFRGCHCAKSNCCSRQCPCFAAGRECDPDVCRNCWVGCGDGTVEGPPPRGDNYSCHNMKLMLKQQQRVLLGRSAVAGWGAFLKNPVARHEYLGEYTGELISHREADKRGKIYDLLNSSFLFNLNDQYVLDACRKGDKLKFANHSLQPNCYAKVVMVSGDHRVGIFAKERITAGEELFYDYQYEPDRAPVWARKPDDPNRKRDDTPSTSRRAQKAA